MIPTENQRPFDLSIAGELNLDLILYGLPLIMETERDLIGTSFVSTLGSSSGIVAHNAACLGLKVRFATLVGDDDFGRLALDRLRQAGVDVSAAIVDPTTSTGVTILLPHGSERHSLTSLGSISKLTVRHLDIAGLAMARHFHLSSLYLQVGLHPDLAKMLSSLKQSGMTISFDTNDDPADKWGPPLDEILPYVDVFLPNEGEICRMAGGCSLDEAVAQIEKKVPTIIVKRGRQGCRVVHEGSSQDIPGLNVQPVDTIGAGDSFDAGFLCSYLNGNDLLTSARAGNISGALSTLAPGGTEAFRDAIVREDFLETHRYPVPHPHRIPRTGVPQL